MNNETDDLHPYTVEVTLRPGSQHQFQWAVRKAGKLVERSDRDHVSEAKAYGSAKAAIERLLAPSFR